jgi:hypothetical protein
VLLAGFDLKGLLGMQRRRFLPFARGAVLLSGLVAVAGLAASAASASARPVSLRYGAAHPAVARHDAQTSSNWAGYAVTPSNGVASSFSNVFGTWVQPAVSCVSGSSSYSAFWVGLGGLAQGSTSLEQIGTGADCAASGTPVYSAWWEILPAAPVSLNLPVRPGDTISAAVTITGKTVAMRLRNLTRHTVVNKKVKMAAPDMTSAEWIAEAPSSCNGSGSCTPLTLASFGSVNFPKAAATESGHSGLITDPSWTATAISLDGSGSAGFGHFAAGGASASAIPSPPTGSGFSVTWEAPTPGSTGN